MPIHTNPAEYILELINIDFATHKEATALRLNEIQEKWDTSSNNLALTAQIQDTIKNADPVAITDVSGANFVLTVVTLLHRSFIKSYRDVVAYGIRIAMYMGLAIMMGTVWLRLKTDQEDIQPYINGIVSVSIAIDKCIANYRQ